MSKYLGPTPFADILPPNLAADACVSNIASALDDVLAKSVQAIPDLLLYARLAQDSGFENPVSMLAPMQRLADFAGGLAELPEAVLDWLAWQLHVDGYETAADMDAKRRLVQMSLLLHRRKGTPWSVRHALEAAFGCPAELTEWFNYGGKPYFFRVAIDVSDAYWGENFSPNAFRLIYEYKNVRSWLEYLITRAKTPLNRFLAAGVRSLTRARPRLYFVPAPLAPVRRHLACGPRTFTRSGHRFWSVPYAPPKLPKIFASCLSGLTTTRLALSLPRQRQTAKSF